MKWRQWKHIDSGYQSKQIDSLREGQDSDETDCDHRFSSPNSNSALSTFLCDTYTIPGVHKSRMTKFCTVAPNIRGSSVWNLFRVTWHLEFWRGSLIWKIYGLLHYPVREAAAASKATSHWLWNGTGSEVAVTCLMTLSRHWPWRVWIRPQKEVGSPADEEDLSQNRTYKVSGSTAITMAKPGVHTHHIPLIPAHSILNTTYFESLHVNPSTGYCVQLTPPFKSSALTYIKGGKTKLLLPTAKFAVDLGSGLRWWKPTLLTVWPVTKAFQLQIHSAELQSRLVGLRQHSYYLYCPVRLELCINLILRLL